MSTLRVWSSALAVLLAAVPARANPLDVFGLTSRRAGQANTGVAAADDAAALYYDPAGLVTRPGGDVALGLVGAYSHLAINAARYELADPLGLQLAARLPLGGALADRVALGFGLHVLSTHVTRITALAPDAANYPYYGDRLSRNVVMPAAAAKLGGGVSLGVALDVLARVSSSADEASGAVRVRNIARVIAGMRYAISPALTLGAVYRQKVEARSVTTALDLTLRATGQYTPHQLAAGVAYANADLAASLDLGWSMWSGYAGPYARIDGGAAPPDVPFRDTLWVRAGVESIATDGLVYRGGYGLESASAPRVQSGVTNLLDGVKHTGAFGLGYVHGRMRVDAHVQLQLVATRELRKNVFDGTGSYDPYTSVLDEDAATDGTQSSNPGYPTLKSGGEVISGGMTVQVSF